MKIPKIIHQTWKDENIPVSFAKMSFSWRNMHSDWEYRFWTDSMNRNFIRDEFPFFLRKYDAYTNHIQRVDAVRYFALYKYGGFYIDMDFECLANIEPIVGDSKCIFGKEPEAHCILHQKEMIICNAFMGSVPGFHFFDFICKELESEKYVGGHPNIRVLETTGPFMLSRLYQQYEKREEISLLESSLIYPLSQEELSRANNHAETNIVQKKLKEAYGIHHFAGTWWKKKAYE